MQKGFSMPDTSAQFAVLESEDTITHGARLWTGLFHSRENYDRASVLTKALNAWRSNALAKRIIEITTEFTVGDGFSFDCKHARAARFLKAWWNDPLNDIDSQLPEWADEAWRTGDLFLLFSVDPSGASYVRALPAELVTQVVTRGNDYRQESAYITGSGLDSITYQAYNTDEEQTSFVLHFPLNRAVGNVFGESDLTSVMWWIESYKQWLDDRSKLNYFRQIFSFTLQKPFTSDAEKAAYSARFKATFPKTPGGIVFLDSTEKLDTLNPNLAAYESGEDGLASSA
jgi:hypothetical protein